MKRFITIVLALIIGASLKTATVANDLSGRVLNAETKPLANATVMINTAAPREGVPVFCPSCYLDCGKKAVTNSEGRFVFHGLDPELVFYLVATAEGHRARGSKKVDPVKDTPDISLDPLPADLPPKRLVRGRVLDVFGEPVVGAQVSPYGCRTDSRRWWGSLPGVDTISITNGNGEFIITSREPAEAFDLEVRSPRHAAKRFTLKETGHEGHELAVEAGGVVHGRLLKNGKPVTGVWVGLVQTDRSSDGFLGAERIGTNEKGEFTFTFVPPLNDFYIYTIMDTMNGSGSLPLRRVTVSKGEPLTELGDLELAAAHTIAGRIVLADGAPLSEPIQLLMSREGAWDSQRAMVGSDGTFRFDNVPDSEPVTFSARVPGYHLIQERNRFQLVRETSLAMFVEGPRDDIEIVYVPDAQKQ